MKLHTLRNRTSVAAGAAVLSIALLGAGCADGDDDATDTGQTEATETATDDTETGDTTDSTEDTGDAAAEGDINGRVGAKYASNVFALVGSDVETEGQLLVITDGDTEVSTADTVSIDGEVVPFTDPSVQEALGEEDYERFEADFETAQVVVAESISVQE